MINMNEFYQKYCRLCGSQRCEREGEWLEGCKHYQEEKENNNDLRRTENGICKVDK